MVNQPLGSPRDPLEPPGAPVPTRHSYGGWWWLLVLIIIVIAVGWGWGWGWNGNGGTAVNRTATNPAASAHQTAALPPAATPAGNAPRTANPAAPATRP